MHTMLRSISAMLRHAFMTIRVSPADKPLVGSDQAPPIPNHKLQETGGLERQTVMPAPNNETAEALGFEGFRVGAELNIKFEPPNERAIGLKTVHPFLQPRPVLAPGLIRCVQRRVGSYSNYDISHSV